MTDSREKSKLEMLINDNVNINNSLKDELNQFKPFNNVNSCSNIHSTPSQIETDTNLVNHNKDKSNSGKEIKKFGKAKKNVDKEKIFENVSTNENSIINIMNDDNTSNDLENDFSNKMKFININDNSNH